MRSCCLSWDLTVFREALWCDCRPCVAPVRRRWGNIKKWKTNLLIPLGSCLAGANQIQIALGHLKSTTTPPIRVMLADSQQFVLWGLEQLIASKRPRMEVVGKADNGTDAKRLAKETQPDILLLDLYLGGGKGAELVPHFVKDGHTRVVIFTGERDLGTVDRAVFNGARGLVRKEDDPATLLNAIQKVHEGELWLDRRTTSRIFFEFARAGGKAPADSVAAKIESLTRKEHTVVSAFANMPGAPNKKVAELLCMSEHTLRNHLTSVFDKLHLAGRFELFEFAKQHHHRFAQTLTDNSSHPAAND